jgi:hypothetical protein
MDDKKQPAYMPMPEDCGRGSQPVFDGVVHVDLLICQYYCTKSCEVYQDYNEAWEVEKKKRRKDALMVSRKPRREALETI